MRPGFLILLVIPLTICLGHQFDSSTRTSVNSEDEFYHKECTRDLEPEYHFLTYNTSNYGCVVFCSFLTSSSSQLSDFLDRSSVKRLLIHGKECHNDSYVCLNGTCVINPLKINPQAISLVPAIPGQGNSFINRSPTIPVSGLHGNAKITVHGGYVKHDDNAFSKTDTYVKVFLNTQSVGTTSVKSNTYYPVWEQQFVADSLTRMDVIKFEVWDSDTEHDDYIGSIATTCDEVVAKRMNNKKKTHYFAKGNGSPINRLSITIDCNNF